jgi:hypothetical protein
MMGDFVMRGSPLFRIRGNGSRLDVRAVHSRVALDNERTHTTRPTALASWSTCEPDNVASIRTLEHAGFERVGTVQDEILWQYAG